MILHAAARVLGCGSAQMALVDQERQSLVIRVAVSNEDEQRFHRVESLLGFSTDGLEVPLSNEDSVLVRAAREGRILVTGRFAELAGTQIPDELAEQIDAVIGPQTFAVVPVSGRAGMLAVILFVKRGHEGFAPADRDLLVAYADRVGAALESGEIDDKVSALESLDDPGVPPPAVLLCDAQLRIVGDEADGQPLDRVLRAGAAIAPLVEAAAHGGDGARSVILRVDDARTLRVTLRPLPAATPPPARFVVVVEDVGWLDRLSREAARARDHLTRVLGTVGGVVLTLDTLGTIVGCTGTARGLFDHAPAALLGRSVRDLLADARTRRRAETFTRHLVAEGFAEGELSFLHEGRPAPAAVSALLLADDRGHPTGSLWRLQDLRERRRGIAERRRLRARLLRSERLSALGQMAARIAHEVRNPLVSIGAAAQVVLEEMGDGAPGHGEVVAIAREVRRLDGIVSDFLHVARPSGMDARRPARAAVDLRSLVEETIELLRARGGAVAFSVTSQGDTLARCDADGIRQVLWNVLTNAVEASPPAPPGGTVTIECDVRQREGRAVVSICDEGPGIPDKVRRRLFDPFFSTKARGTGLGLAISRQIVEEHHGRLRLTPRRPHGTRVAIELPA